MGGLEQRLQDDTKEIPFPVESGAYRVLQLYVKDAEGKECAEMAAIKNDEGRHANALEDYLKKHGLSFETRPSRDNPSVQVPSEKGKGYRVVGGGTMVIFSQTGILGGESTEYEMPIDVPHLNDYQGEHPELTLIKSEMPASTRSRSL